MKIRLLGDYRGWITNERYYKAGVHDFDTKTANALIENGRAINVATAQPIEDQPEPIIPAEDAPNRNVKASKSARELAEAHNLILWSVKGTGKDGAITLKDVQKLVK